MARSNVMGALAAILIVLSVPKVYGQTTDPREILARVNGDIIARAEFLDRLDDYKDELAYKMSGCGNTEADINAELERAKPALLDTMIDELLLEQKARHLGYEAEAEREWQIFLKGAIGYEKEIEGPRPSGFVVQKYEDLRRKAWLREYLLRKEVLIPIYNAITVRERQEFYDKNQAVFMTAARVTLSEIFLECEDGTRPEIERRARSLVRELRTGLSFTEAVRDYTPPNRASYRRDGELGSFKLDDLNKVTAVAISSLEPSDITDPIRLQEGYQILWLDARDDPKLLDFTSPDVQECISRALTMERAEEAKKAYIARLREEATISVLSPL